MRDLLLLRADAGAQIGTGHVMRCLALGQAWQETGGSVAFAWSELPPALEKRLLAEGFAGHALDVPPAGDADLAATAALAARLGATWIAVDGYRFGPDYLAGLRAAAPVVCLDDMAHLPAYPVDVLLNQNLGADRERYGARLPASARALCGPRYALLRREFRNAIPRRAPLPGRLLRVLVTLGGSDPENHTGRLLDRLAAGPAPLEALVVAGAANPHLASLRARAAAAPFRCRIVVDSDRMAELMGWADVALSAGGSTVWELAALRLPALVGAISPDQFATLPALRRIRGFLAAPMDDVLACDLAPALADLAAAPADFAAFDADGALRVARTLALPLIHPVSAS